MNGREAVRAAIEAARQGQEADVFRAGRQPGALNNLNLNKSQSLDLGDPHNPAPQAGSSSQKLSNLNNLKAPESEKRGGVPRRQLYEDGALSKAMAWGVEEWLVQVCIRDYGLYTVKAAINRIHTLPAGYFKPQYGPLDGQRGRLFNKEMQKLKEKKRVS